MMRTNDGLELHHTDPKGIVMELHKMSMAPCASDAEFMRQSAARTAQVTGKRVSCASPEEFVRCLIEVGVLIDE